MHCARPSHSCFIHGVFITLAYVSLMELGLILLTAGLAFAVFILIIGRNSRTRKTEKIWIHHKKRPRVRTVGPCAVAVGVYKTYEDRKRLEKMRSEYELKEKSPE